MRRIVFYILLAVCTLGYAGLIDQAVSGSTFITRHVMHLGQIAFSVLLLLLVLNEISTCVAGKKTARFWLIVNFLITLLIFFASTVSLMTESLSLDHVNANVLFVFSRLLPALMVGSFFLLAKYCLSHHQYVESSKISLILICIFISFSMLWQINLAVGDVSMNQPGYHTAQNEDFMGWALPSP